MRTVPGRAKQFFVRHFFLTARKNAHSYKDKSRKRDKKEKEYPPFPFPPRGSAVQMVKFFDKRKRHIFPRTLRKSSQAPDGCRSLCLVSSFAQRRYSDTHRSRRKRPTGCLTAIFPSPWLRENAVLCTMPADGCRYGWLLPLFCWLVLKKSKGQAGAP